MTFTTHAHPIAAAMALSAAIWAMPTHAALEGRSLSGAGFDNNPSTLEAYYDTDLNITWMKDANLFATQYTANPNAAAAIVAGTPTFADPVWGPAFDPATGLYPVTTDADLTNPNATSAGAAVDGAMSWFGAQAWINSLNAQNYGGYSDWRLPKVSPQNGTGFAIGGAFDGSTDDGYRIASPNSELSHVFYATLGNSAGVDLQGNAIGGGGLLNSGPFVHFKNDLYWYGTDTPDVGQAWAFQNGTGNQTNASDKPFTYAYAFAVRPGDIAAVPIPGAIWLLGSAMAGLSIIGRRRKG